jgi:plastocyanin
MLRSRPLLVFALLSLSLAAIGTAAPLLMGGGAPAGAANNHVISVGDTWFCGPSSQGGVCQVQITPGDTVIWDFSGASLSHSTRECGASCDSPAMSPLWDSGIISNGSTFQFTFDQAGTFLYRCSVHPDLMRGRIVVQPSPPPPTVPPTPTPRPGKETPAPATRPGDVDCSGGISAIDAALVLQFDARLLQSLRCPQNGDTNRDGRTNSLDAALILQRVAGLIGTLPPA